MRVMLCSGLSHQSGFTTMFVPASGLNDSSLNGPVPMAVVEAAVLTPVAMLPGLSEPVCSIHSLSMM